MTTTPNPNRAETALALLDAVYDWQEREGSTDATELANVLAAQAVATLALEAQTARLADEARTANLIAYFDLGGPDDLGTPGVNYSALRFDIAARLDLTQDVTP